MIDQTIGNFRVVERIGRGAMGEVWRAEQTSIGTKAAIKLLRPELSEDKDHVRRFFNEAVAVGKIQHAGIVKIFDVGFHGGQAYLLMELLEGETLAARLAKSPKLPMAQVFDIVRQIATILEATHAAGIVHRDLKPDNVFVVPDAGMPSRERIKVLDFGIAKLSNATASMTGTGGSLGTPTYMAPEQWKNSKSVDARADIYSLGCVAFQMACGRPPFVADSVGEACLMHMAQDPPHARAVSADVPESFDALIIRMLAKDVADRPTLREVIATIDGKPAAKPRATSLASADTADAIPVQKKSRAPLLAIAALVLTGGGIAAYALTREEPPTIDNGPTTPAIGSGGSFTNVVGSRASPGSDSSAGSSAGSSGPSTTGSAATAIPAFGFGPDATDVFRGDFATHDDGAITVEGTAGDVHWVVRDAKPFTISAVTVGGSVRLEHRAQAIGDKLGYQLTLANTLPAFTPLATSGDDADLARLRSVFASPSAFADATATRDDAVNVGSAPGEVQIGGKKIQQWFRSTKIRFALHEVVALRLSHRALAAAMYIDLIGPGIVEKFRLTALLVDDEVVLTHWSMGGPFARAGD